MNSYTKLAALEASYIELNATTPTGWCELYDRDMESCRIAARISVLKKRLAIPEDCDYSIMRAYTLYPRSSVQRNASVLALDIEHDSHYEQTGENY